MLKKYPNLSGYISLLLWSTCALATTQILRLPIFEILSIIFLSSFLLHSARLTLQKKWHLVRQPLSQWVLGISGVGVQQISYIFAFKLAPAAEVDLIVYLWPIFVTLLAMLKEKNSSRFRYLVGALIGFLGITLLNQGHDFLNLSGEVLKGFGFAFVCALSWSFYSVTSKRIPHVPSEVIGLYMGFSLLLTFPFHFMTEKFMMPSWWEASILTYMGVFTSGFAYYLWDYGMKKGNIFLLSVLSYMNPIVSISFLILAGVVAPTKTLAMSAFLVAVGGLIGGVPWVRLRKFLELNAVIPFRQTQAFFIK